MGIWRDGEFAGGWLWPDRWERKGPDEGGLTAAGALGELIEAESAMLWRRLRALGW